MGEPTPPKLTLRPAKPRGGLAGKMAREAERRKRFALGKAIHDSGLTAREYAKREGMKYDDVRRAVLYYRQRQWSREG